LLDAVEEYREQNSIITVIQTASNIVANKEIIPNSFVDGVAKKLTHFCCFARKIKTI